MFLQGNHFTRGCRQQDYNISLGDGRCLIVDFADNEIDCTPPAKKPNKNDTFCPADQLSLQVAITGVIFKIVQHK